MSTGPTKNNYPISGCSLNNLKKYVRVKTAPDAKFVEFDFAIEDPNLFVELILPRAAFNEFCEKNSVIFMTETQAAEVDEHMKKWRYGDKFSSV